jgi:hypothetical protein
MTPDEQYEWVENFFNTDTSGFCETDCPHFYAWREPHGERLCGCKLLETGDGLNANLCPALKGQTDSYTQRMG